MKMTAARKDWARSGASHPATPGGGRQEHSGAGAAGAAAVGHGSITKVIYMVHQNLMRALQ